MDNKQEKIDKINGLVQAYKDGDINSAEELIHIFDPFLLKNCQKYNQLYPGVHEWESIRQEAMVIFKTLLDEYEIGGIAYFNVYLMKKLPLRLRYFFIKEIRHRGKNLCHEEGQMIIKGQVAEDNNIEDFINRESDKITLNTIIEIMQSDLLTERERDMIKMNIIDQISHEKIGQKYGISRSRVSKIINSALQKVRTEYNDYLYYMEGDK